LTCVNALIHARRKVAIGDKDPCVLRTWQMQYPVCAHLPILGRGKDEDLATDVREIHRRQHVAHAVRLRQGHWHIEGSGADSRRIARPLIDSEVRHAAADPAGDAHSREDRAEGGQEHRLLRNLDASVFTTNPACRLAPYYGVGLWRHPVGKQERPAGSQGPRRPSSSFARASTEPLRS